MADFPAGQQRELGSGGKVVTDVIAQHHHRRDDASTPWPQRAAVDGGD